MPLPLQTPLPSSQLTSEFAIKGGIKLLLDEIVSPVVLLQRRPRKYAMGFATVANGGVGNRTEIAIVNTFFPEPGVNGEVHVHSIWMTSSGAQAFLLKWPTVALAGFADIATERFLDSARAGSPQAAFQEDNGSAETTGTSFLRFLTGANAAASRREDFDPPIIISPFGARALIIMPEADNVGLEGAILWSEPPDPV